AERLEVRLYAFGYQSGRIGDEFHVLDVHFIHDEVADLFDAPARQRVEHRYEDLRQRLAHLDVHLAAQGEHHRGDTLGYGHHLFQFRVYQRSVGRGEGA